MGLLHSTSEYRNIPYQVLPPKKGKKRRIGVHGIYFLQTVHTGSY